MKVICKTEVSWEGAQYKREKIYEVELTDKMKEFIKVGYFKPFEETKEYKGEIKTKIVKAKKNVKNRSVSE